MQNEMENKMDSVEEISGPIADLGNYKLDYADGNIVFEANIAKSTDSYMVESKNKVQIPAEAILRKLAESTETKLDDAALEWILKRL